MTGLGGFFDFSLEILGSPSGNAAATKTAILSWDTIFSDIQEQLGLRLEPSKGSIDVLVIDHVERPTVD